MNNFKDFYLGENEKEHSLADSFFEACDKHSDEEMEEKFAHLTDEQLDKINTLCIEEDDEFSLYTDDMTVEAAEELSEKLIKKIVIRGGKKIKKFKSDRKNFRIVLDPDTNKPKEEKMSPDEVRKRKKGQIRGARKRKAGKAIANLKRKLSNKKRKQIITRK